MHKATATATNRIHGHGTGDGDLQGRTACCKSRARAAHSVLGPLFSSFSHTTDTELKIELREPVFRLLPALSYSPLSYCLIQRPI